MSANKKVTKTFDLVSREFNVVRVGPFIKFCRDFKIPCKLNQHIMAFNKAFEQGLNRDDRAQVESGGVLEFTDFKFALAMCFDLHKAELLKKLKKE